MAWHNQPTTNPAAKTVAAQLRALAAAIEREGAEWEVKDEAEIEQNEGMGWSTPRQTGWRTLTIRVLAGRAWPTGGDDPMVGDVIRVHDRLDFTWLGVIRDALAYEGYPVYVCDLWRIENGELVWRPRDRFYRAEFDIVLRAREQAVGR